MQKELDEIDLEVENVRSPLKTLDPGNLKIVRQKTDPSRWI